MINRPGRKELLIAAAGALILVIVITTSALTVWREADYTVQEFTSSDVPGASRVVVDVKLISADPIKGDMLARLSFDGAGPLFDEDEGIPTENLVMSVNGATGRLVIPFKAGEPMNPTEVMLGLYGAVMRYPFDHHEGALVVSFATPLIASSPTPAGGVSHEPIPVVLHYAETLTGYRISASQVTPPEPGTVELDIRLARSNSVLIFALFIMGLQWLLAFAALLALWTWLVRGNKIEVTMFGWMAGLLFALIPLRNAMPGIPPVGTLSDFLSFFWIEAIIAICMFVAVGTWAFYRARRQ